MTERRCQMHLGDRAAWLFRVFAMVLTDSLVQLNQTLSKKGEHMVIKRTRCEEWSLVGVGKEVMNKAKYEGEREWDIGRNWNCERI